MKKIIRRTVWLERMKVNLIIFSVCFIFQLIDETDTATFSIYLLMNICYSLADPCMARLTECPLCLDDFLEPRQLPCTHTYCTSCLEDLIRTCSSGGFYCPECRMYMQVLPILLQANSTSSGILLFSENVSIFRWLLPYHWKNGKGWDQVSTPKNYIDCFYHYFSIFLFATFFVTLIPDQYKS